MYDSDSHCGRSIPMFPSSGMGNSRLVAEGEEMAAALLGAVFKEVYERLGRDPNDDPVTQMSARLHGSTSRGVCFTSVLEVANESLASMPKHLANRRQKISTDIDVNNIYNWRNGLYKHFCLEAAKSLAMGLQRFKHDRFIIAFDECKNIKPPVPFPECVGARTLSPIHGISLLALQRMIKTQDPFHTKGLTFGSFSLIQASRLLSSLDLIHATRYHQPGMLLSYRSHLGPIKLVESSVLTPSEALSSRC
ncbi:uncharacterized protein EI90DRAFT_3292298 [Cantharellus anzutake]|uniref:uncharacterized protein n=1 Tax=Cantharellus anzutake TaxID=1750568 RepID=UPI00190733E1|nr:uncharacterized protein EI90DRAFT_3292298 [Cantharellus anzutake]KAF8324220.1 hypothetical protein EI90DRAFT_3292298 [Cantharellus anzutake]